MKARSKSIVILFVLFGYILLQFIWWEVLLVRQTGEIINEKQKLTELSVSDETRLRLEIETLHRTKKMKTIMIAGEGTVFLLLLLFGLYKIKQAMDAEASLGRQQKNFFLSVTHELKTPIAATKLQLQTLQRQKLDQQTQSLLLQNALNETERLNQLIDNILFASRLESEQFVLRTTKTNVSQLSGDTALRYYQKYLLDGKLSLQLQNDLFAEVDADAFQSVITNLIDNAFKYAGENAQVNLSLKRNGAELVLSVSDNGPGIKAEDKNRVFERFFRAGDEETRKTKGTGLGLYIVSYLVDKHNGKIRVRDNQPKGCIFEVSLNAI